MVAAAPPEKLAAQPQIPGWEETVEQKQDRYQQIASELYEVVYDPATVPLFGGPRGRATTAATILAVAFHEGGFAHDVDVGPCYRGKGFSTRCDGGATACLLQVKIGDGATAEGWTQKDLFADRHKCFRAGLRLMRKSQRACGAKFGRDHWLTAYAAGVCDNSAGQLRSRELTAIARRFLARPGQPVEADSTFLLPAPSAGPEGDLRSK
jgi:hypothetical protein